MGGSTREITLIMPQWKYIKAGGMKHQSWRRVLRGLDETAIIHIHGGHPGARLAINWFDVGYYQGKPSGIKSCH